MRTSRDHLYTGISTDPTRRVNEHNNTKQGSKALRGQRPVVLVWLLPDPQTKSEALKLERAIKSLSHEDKEEFISTGDTYDKVKGLEVK